MVDFSNLSVGEELPALQTDKISRTTLALYAGASGDHNPIHIDPDFAASAGFDDIFAQGMLSMAYLGRLLTNWVPQSYIKNIDVRFSSITPVNIDIICTGIIKSKTESASQKTLEIEIEAKDGNTGDIKILGLALLDFNSTL
ncbi:MAG: MaoC family dehydratase [Colwellia sp.]|jgi:Acyl dehydratase